MSATKQRHEKRKVERTRRRRSLFRNPQSAIRNGGAAALAAAAVIAAGTQAYADPVRFDNVAPGAPGWFDWNETSGEISRFLDVTLALEDQPPDTAAASPISFGQVRDVYAAYGLVQAKSAPSELQVGGYCDYVLVGVPSDTLIPSGTPWLSFGYADWYGAETPDGLATYLGVRFDQGAGLQYGWIGVVRTGLRFDTFAWGYETEVGVAIPAGAIPEPGSLALLAFGAVAVCRRRP